VAAERGRLTARRRGAGQRGSALLLMPAGLLIVVLLAAVAFDVSRLYLARRELVDVAASAASDIAAEAIDPAAYLASGELRWSQARADAALREALARRGLEGDVRGSVSLGAGSSPQVEVVLEADVRWLFARGLPGGGATTTVRGGGWAVFDTF